MPCLCINIAHKHLIECIYIYYVEHKKIERIDTTANTITITFANNYINICINFAQNMWVMSIVVCKGVL